MHILESLHLSAVCIPVVEGLESLRSLGNGLRSLYQSPPLSEAKANLAITSQGATGEY